jgi:hypothetical protein
LPRATISSVHSARAAWFSAWSIANTVRTGSASSRVAAVAASGGGAVTNRYTQATSVADTRTGTERQRGGLFRSCLEGFRSRFVVFSLMDA